MSPSPKKASFHWADPLLLDQQLSEDERMVRESARAYCQDKLAPRVLEVDGDHRAEGRREAHLHQDPARGHVAGDRVGVAVELATDHDNEGLIEAAMDPLLGHRHSGLRALVRTAVLEDVAQVR